MTNHWLTNRDSLLLKRCHRISKMWGPHKSCAKLELYCIIIKWWCNTILRTEPIVTAISNVSSWFHQFLGEIWDGCADVGRPNCPVQGSLIRTGWISCILWSLSHCRPGNEQSNATFKGLVETMISSVYKSLCKPSNIMYHAAWAQKTKSALVSSGCLSQNLKGCLIF